MAGPLLRELVPDPAGGECKSTERGGTFQSEVAGGGAMWRGVGVLGQCLVPERMLSRDISSVTLGRWGGDLGPTWA